MAAALVAQTNNIITVATTAPTAAVTATPGNFLVALWFGSGGLTGTFTAHTDTGGNLWQKLYATGVSGGTNTAISAWYVANCASPGTITGTTSSQTFSWIVAEFSGMPTSPTTPLDGLAWAENPSVLAQATPQIGPTSIGLRIAQLGCGSTGTYTLAAGSGGWNQFTVPAANGSIHGIAAYKIASFTGWEQAAWTLSIAAKAEGATAAWYQSGSGLVEPAPEFRPLPFGARAGNVSPI